jgi:signal transduction histidine kinase
MSEPDATAEVVVAFSHELRSPLASLRGFTQLLLDRWDRIPDTDRRDLLGQIDHDARRVSRLVDELLDVSRIDTGRYSVWRGPVDIVTLCEDVVRRVHVVHPDVRCPVVAESDVPDVLADADKIEQVVTNLVENGAKYATADRLAIDVRRVGDQVEVAVSDAGPGLDPEARLRVFDRFATASGGRPSGLGLGLWIARTIAEAHGGSLRADGNDRGGTTFRLTLPVSTPTD